MDFDYYPIFSKFSTRWVITATALKEIAANSTDRAARKLAARALWMAEYCKDPQHRTVVESMVYGLKYEPGAGQAPW